MNFSLVTSIAGNPLAFGAVVFLYSLVIGSFLNVVIYRLPIVLERSWRRDCEELESGITLPPATEKFNLVVPRSRCPHCGHQIRAWENIPVLSYLILGGKCSQCKARISFRYPFVESLAAVLSTVTALQLGPTLAGLAAVVLVWGLIALAFIDFDHQILPDVIVLPGVWMGLLLNTRNMFTSLESAVYGAVAGYVSLWLVYQLFKLATGKEGMGFGDFKLFALLGAWLGWQQLPLIILLSSLAGALLGVAMILVAGRDKQLPMPFGPFLCIAGWVALLWGKDIVSGYLHLFQVAPFPG
ncbi:MAG: prepilin peptidase [Acidiferrobacterales bacterium]